MAESVLSTGECTLGLLQVPVPWPFVSFVVMMDGQTY
jgi:hypothetical protein